MKKVYLFLIIVLVLFLVIYGNIATISNKKIDYINIYLTISNFTDSKVEEKNISLFSPAGKVIKGSTSITNNDNKEDKIKISLEGDLSKWIIIEQNSFILKPKEAKTVSLTVTIPKEAIGNYSSLLIIESS